MAVQYAFEVEHTGLGRNRVVTGADEETARSEANALARTWQCEYELEHVQNILRPALNAKHAVDWEKLKRHEKYLASKPSEVVYVEFPPEPKIDDPPYQLTPNNTEIIVKAVEEQKTREAEERFARDYAAWAEAVRQVEFENQRRYAESMAAVEEWNDGLAKHRQTLAAHNTALEKLKMDYASLLPEAVENYFHQVLSASPLPESLSCEVDLQYVPDAKILVVEHSLPSPEILPKVKEIKYLKSRGELVEVPFSDAALNRIYTDVICQICLRTLYELFDADTSNALTAIAFNGYVETSDETNGSPNRTCVISVPAKKDAFQTLDLWDSDSKTCIKTLKGAASSKGDASAPVKPALRITR